MPLDPSLNVDGDPDSVKVSATDVAGSSECGLFLALKTRPSVRAVDGWSPLFAPWGEGVPAPVVIIVDLVVEAHSHNFGTYEAQARWLDDAIVRQKVHRLLRSYIRLAVDNTLEAHESIEAELGPLRLLTTSPSIGPRNRQLAAWGPLYETADGIREIRRFRHGAARGDENSEKWSLIAAYVAAAYGEFVPSRRVRVTEIGALDGSTTVLFDGTAATARADFLTSGRGLASAAAEDSHVAPCRSCGDCKAAGRCRELVSGRRHARTVGERSLLAICFGQRARAVREMSGSVAAGLGRASPEGRRRRRGRRPRPGCTSVAPGSAFPPDSLRERGSPSSR